MKRRAPIRQAIFALLTAIALGAPVRAQEIRFGLFTPIETGSWEDLRGTWAEAETLGFDSLWVNDHLTSTPPSDDDQPEFEAWTALAALATATSRARIGVLVTGNTYRNPALLAKMATTVDHISGGRLILGIGAGWFEREHEAYGFYYGTARERARRLEEALQVITKLWGEDHPDFEGQFYSLANAPFAPANLQRPRVPIVIGGQGKQWIIPLVARYADGWNSPMGVSPEGLRERRDIIAAECERIGREPCPTDVSVQLVLVTITRIPLAGPLIRLGARAIVEGKMVGSLLAGSPAGIRDHIRQYVEAGAQEVIVTLRPPYDRELMREFAKEVMLPLRGEGES